MKLLNNEEHELGNGWGFYIDTDIDNNSNKSYSYSYSYVNSSRVKYKNMNIIPEIPEIPEKIHEHTKNIHKYDDNNAEINKTFVDIDVISVLSLTFTCLLAFLIH